MKLFRERDRWKSLLGLQGRRSRRISRGPALVVDRLVPPSATPFLYRKRPRMPLKLHRPVLPLAARQIMHLIIEVMNGYLRDRFRSRILHPIDRPRSFLTRMYIASLPTLNIREPSNVVSRRRTGIDFSLYFLGVSDHI